MQDNSCMYLEVKQGYILYTIPNLFSIFIVFSYTKRLKYRDRKKST